MVCRHEIDVKLMDRLQLLYSTVCREPGKHCQNNLGIWCIVWTGKMCVMCSVKCRNSCHPRCGIESIWRWHQAMWLWHIYYVLFYSLEQFYFSSPCHSSTFSLFSSQIGCFNLYFVHFLEQRCIRLPSASDAMSPYGEYSPQIIDD